MRATLALALALAVATAAPLAGQTATSEPVQAPAQVVILDLERLFDETAYGRRVAREIELRATSLASENRRIEAELRTEERDLTERRATLSVDEFRTLADAFNEKVDRIRQEQDGKTRDVQRLREGERQRFFSQIGPVLSALVLEREASVVLDRRSVFIAAESADITDEAIARIDREIGDGAPQNE